MLSLQMAALVAAVLAVLLLLSAPAWAGPSRDDAAVAAQRLSNGRVLSIEKLEPAHGALWRVKVVTAQGEIRIVLIDAASGRTELPDRPGFVSPSVQSRSASQTRTLKGPAAGPGPPIGVTNFESVQVPFIESRQY